MIHLSPFVQTVWRSPLYICTQICFLPEGVLLSAEVSGKSPAPCSWLCYAHIVSAAYLLPMPQELRAPTLDMF